MPQRRNTHNFMNFTGYALSRDMLYISAAVTGIALGLLLSTYKKELRLRNRRITLALLFFSGTIVSIAVSFIASMGEIFKDSAVLITAGIFMGVCALAVCFPRGAAYPLILLGGLVVTWLGLTCLRFPEYTNSSAVVIAYPENSEAGDAYLIRFASDARNANASSVISGDTAGIIRINGKHPFLVFSIAVIQIERYFPFAGGSKHGLITGISSEAGQEFSDYSLDGPLVKPYYSWLGSGSRSRGIGISRIEKTVNLEGIVPGKEIFVSIDSDNGINHY